MAAPVTLSPITLARVRVLVLPVGRIQSSRFLEFFELLAPWDEIRLGDVTPDPRPDRNLFSPLQSPDGVLLYQFGTSAPSPSRLALSPFEIVHEPFVVLGVADGSNFAIKNDEAPDSAKAAASEALDRLLPVVDELRDRYPRALVHRLLLFDAPDPVFRLRKEDLIIVPVVDQLKTTTMKTIMCDVTSAVLAEMTSLVRAIQALPSVPSPAASTGATNVMITDNRSNDTNAVQLDSFANGRARSASPALGRDSHSHRKSMPVLSSDSSTSSPVTGSRPMSPESGTRSPPPRTFEEITGEGKVVPLGRANSQDRVSVHGFGSGSLDEWNRNRGKNRIAIVVGSISLLAGRWQDALKDLSDATIKARMYSDHLWHAKALELILTCMLLLSWARMRFQMPTVCLPIPEKATGFNPSQISSANSSADTSSPAASASEHTTQLRNLGNLIPDLINMITSIQSRPTSNLGEILPQLAVSESVIRMTSLLTALNLAGGSLTDDVLQRIVRRSTLPADDMISSSRIATAPRTTIANLLLRAYPNDTSVPELSPLDRLGILGAISSIFSALGLVRKKALLMQEYMESLIAVLTQSQIAGAAEAGVHPSASLSALSPSYEDVGSNPITKNRVGDMHPEHGLGEFLSILCRIYGVPESKWLQLVAGVGSQDKEPTDANEHIEGSSSPTQQNSTAPLGQVVSNFILHSFGSINLKAGLLRLCIRLCEALRDIPGILHYTSTLLRTAGPGVALSAESVESVITLSKDEQIALSRNIIQTAASARLLGCRDVEADFWDEFLVRGCYVLGPSPALELRPQKRSAFDRTLPGDSTSRKGPFLYDAFAQKLDNEETLGLIVSGEEREFVIALQNPYEFDLEIESLKVVSSGQAFACSKQTLTIRPARIQSFSITGLLSRTGNVKIDGCVVKVKCCRERFFSVFAEPWAPDPEVRIKSTGLMGLQPSQAEQASAGPSSQETLSHGLPLPVPSSTTLKVIPQQPVLIIMSSTLSQGAVMLLEGQRKVFSIMMKNISNVTANYIRVTCEDSATSAIKEAVMTKGLQPVDLYMMEEELALPGLQEDISPTIKNVSRILRPGDSEEYVFIVFGKAGLTSANITIDYANVGTSDDESMEHFYSRRISVPVAVTVNASVQIHRCDILTIEGTFTQSALQVLQGEDTPSNGGQMTKSTEITAKLLWGDALEQDRVSRNESRHYRAFEFHGELFSLLIVDLRNAWPTPLSASLQLVCEPADVDCWKIPSSWGQTATIQPGHIERLVIPVPKLYIEHAYMSVMRGVRSAKERQFVVTNAGITPDIERMHRQMFWFRVMLLRMLSAEWSTEDGSRKGRIPLSQLQFSPRMLEALKLDDMAISMEIVSPMAETPRAQRGSYRIKADSLTTLRTKVTNRTSHQIIHPILRLLPLLAYQTHDLEALDLGKRLACSGLLQQRLKSLGPGEHITTEIGLCALCSGEYEIAASVDEVRTATNTINEEQSDGKWDDGLYGPVLDAVALGAPKRHWAAQKNCRIVAVADV